MFKAVSGMLQKRMHTPFSAQVYFSFLCNIGFLIVRYLTNTFMVYIASIVKDSVHFSAAYHRVELHVYHLNERFIIAH